MKNPITHFMRNAKDEDTTQSDVDGDTDADDVDDGRPCSETGHNYEFTGVIEHHTRKNVGVFGDDSETFIFYKKERYKCTKCETVDFRKVDIGEVDVDTETDELEIVDQVD